MIVILKGLGNKIKLFLYSNLFYVSHQNVYENVHKEKKTEKGKVD